MGRGVVFNVVYQVQGKQKLDRWMDVVLSITQNISLLFLHPKRKGLFTWNPQLLLNV